MWISSSHM